MHQAFFRPLVQKIPHSFIKRINLFLNTCGFQPIIEVAEVFAFLKFLHFFPMRFNYGERFFKKVGRLGRFEFPEGLAGFLIKIQVVMIHKMTGQVI